MDEMEGDEGVNEGPWKSGIDLLRPENQGESRAWALEREAQRDRIALVGTNAEKEPKIQEHFRENLTFTNIGSKEFEFFPKSGRDPKAYLSAIKAFKPGDLCTVFTPDDTHFEICKAALEGGLHVLVTKPMVKTLAQHKELVSIAKAKGVLLQIEVHKRFDPIYNDARQRIQSLGTFGYFTSFMSQPKMQLETFREWVWQPN
ncbi:Uncharacterized oxidoreductase YdgJ [Durusdinium trenchii]|uniref:Uncharacterized oxidoreductase YdgJ n=1 Tax=Durusdinium trenchii TaxID=1381693 RepID=A0ABP0LBN2_9DINO